MNSLNSLLALPFETLFILAIGYAGQRAIHVGRSGAISASDRVFFAIVFAALAKAFLLGSALIYSSDTLLATVGAYITAALLTLVCSFVWRQFLQEGAFRTVRRIGLGDNDGFESAWESLIGRSTPPISQLVVRMKSGRQLICDNLSQFADAPLGPCLFGGDGSIAIYATHVRSSSDDDWDECETKHDQWGVALTFVRAEEVSDVEVRFLT